MAHPTKQERVRTRTAPQEHELRGVEHVFIKGSPAHYVPGYGYMEKPEGTVILLDTDNPDPDKAIKAGKWLQRVDPRDAEKAADDPEKAAELAEKAAEVKKQELADLAAEKKAAEDQAAADAAKAAGKPTTK